MTTTYASVFCVGALAGERAGQWPHARHEWKRARAAFWRLGMFDHSRLCEERRRLCEEVIARLQQQGPVVRVAAYYRSDDDSIGGVDGLSALTAEERSEWSKAAASWQKEAQWLTHLGLADQAEMARARVEQCQRMADRPQPKPEPLKAGLRLNFHIGSKLAARFEAERDLVGWSRAEFARELIARALT